MNFTLLEYTVIGNDFNFNYIFFFFVGLTSISIAAYELFMERVRV